MVFDVTIWQAFQAGAAQIILPSLLPLVPFFVGYMVIAATVYATSTHTHSKASTIFRTSIIGLFFLTGFMTVFIGLGSSSTIVGQIFASWKGEVISNRARAIFIYGMYFFLLRWYIIEPINVRLRLYYNKLPLISTARREFKRYIAIYEFFAHTPLRNTLRFSFAIAMGATLAIMWIPVVGPVLAVALTYAAAESTAFKGISLLTFFAMGMSLPLYILALGIIRLLPIEKHSREQLKTVEITMGGIIAFTGILMMTEQINKISIWLLDTFPGLGSIG